MESWLAPPRRATRPEATFQHERGRLALPGPPPPVVQQSLPQLASPAIQGPQRGGHRAIRHPTSLPLPRLRSAIVGCTPEGATSQAGPMGAAKQSALSRPPSPVPPAKPARNPAEATPIGPQTERSISPVMAGPEADPAAEPTPAAVKAPPVPPPALPPPAGGAEVELPVSLPSPPNDFLDPITEELLQDPVLTETGYTFERSSIEAWFDRCRRDGRQPSDPLTGSILASTQVGLCR